ncbi:MAG: YceD family protein [Bacteroidales bacterium]
MSYTEAYNILYEGLSLGEHTYEYIINNGFFSRHGTGAVSSGDLLANVVLVKHASFMELYFDIEGDVDIECDRCLDLYKHDIHYNGKLIVKLSDKHIDDGDDIVWIDKKEGTLHLAKWINEFIVLSLPMRCVHPDDANGKSTCNKTMMSYIDIPSRTPDKEEQTNDAGIWDALKALKENDKNK